MGLANLVNADGTIKQLDSEVEKEQQKEQDFLFTAGKYIAAPVGEEGLRSDVLEASKAAGAGFIQGNKELLKMIPRIASYVPYARTPIDAAVAGGASLIAGMTNDRELDQAFDLSTMMENRSQEVTNIQDFLNLDKMDNALDELAAPYLKALEKEHDFVSDTLTNISNLTGQFISPMPVLKGLGYGYRIAKSEKLQSMIKGSHKVITDDINKQVKIAPDELKTIMNSPLERYKFLEKQRANKKEMIDLSPVAKEEMQRLEKYERKLSKVQEINKQSLRSATFYEAAAALSGAIAVNYVEDLAPENREWLAPVAGLMAAFFVPPVAIGHGRAISFNILGNFSRYVLKNEDTALDHFIRARGMNPNSVRDKNGVVITDRAELRKAKERLLGTDVAQMKFYEKLGKQIAQLPDDEKSLIYKSLENYQRIYDKMASKALAKGMPEIAEKFVPLVHNVLHLQGMRSLQSSLLGNVDAGFFLSSQRLFKQKLTSELDNLVQQQQMQVEFLYKDIESLRLLRDDNEIDVLLNEFSGMVQDAQRTLGQQSGIITAAGDDLSTILKKKTVGLEDLKLQRETTDIKKKFSLEEKLSLNDPVEVAKFDKQANIVNNRLMENIRTRAKEDVNNAYADAFTDASGNPAVMKSDRVFSQINKLIEDRQQDNILIKSSPSASLLKIFKEDLLTNNLRTLDDVGIDDIASKVERMIKVFKENPSRIPDGMNFDDFKVEYKINGFQDALKRFTDDKTDKGARESLIAFYNKQIFTDERDTLSQISQGSYAGDLADRLRNDYERGAIKLIDLHNLRIRYIDRLYGSKSNKSKSDANEMLDVLNEFFDSDDVLTQVSGAKYQQAKNIFKETMMPLRRKEILKQQKVQNEAVRFAGEPSPLEIDQLRDIVAGRDTGADDLFIQLIDPTLADSPASAINTLKTMKRLAGAENKETFNRSIRRAFAKALYDEDAVSGRPFHNRFDRNYLNTLKDEQIISETDFNDLVKIPDFHGTTKGEVFKENQKIFDGLIGNLKSIQEERGGTLAGGLLQAAVTAGRRSKDVESRNLAIADALSVTGDQESIGLRYFAGKVDPSDKRILDIEEQLGPEDAVNFGAILRGETSSFKITKGGKERTIRYPNNVNTAIDKLIYELDYDIEQGGQIAKNAEQVKSALNDIFISAIETRAFKRTNIASSLGSQTKTLAGREQKSGFLDNLDAPALEEAVNMYRPYFEAIHKRGTKIKNPSTGQMEEVNILDELDDIVTISRSVTQPIGGGKQLTGVPRPFSFDSILSRAWGVARGVVSPRYVISEFGLRALRKGQSEILKEFLTDPTAIHAIHNVFVKGRTTTPYVRTFYQKLFGTPTWSILLQTTRTEDEGYLEAFFNRHGKDDTKSKAEANLTEGETALIKYLENKYNI